MLRLLADDLTGALDSAAPFAAALGPLPVAWDEAGLGGAGHLAFDGETRGLDPDAAAARVAGLAGLMRGAATAFLMIDSRLRGHPARAIAACARAGGFRSVVIAPAFPAQGRVTRGGRQHVRGADGAWEAVEPDLAAALAEAGLPVRLTGCPAGEGVYLCDAATDAELARIAAARLTGPVLWCGTGGLARALAGRPAMAPVRLGGPVLVVAGSPHPATRQQVGALAGCRAVVHALDIAACTSPAAARRAHGELIAAAAAGPAPGTLLATGGETLLALCRATAASRLEVVGEMEPGIPVSRIVGGRWDGVTVVSKSGGFGKAGLFLELIEGVEHGRA